MELIGLFKFVMLSIIICNSFFETDAGITHSLERIVDSMTFWALEVRSKGLYRKHIDRG